MQATLTQPSSPSQTSQRASQTRQIPLDPLVESIWRNFVDTDRVPVLVLPESVEPRSGLLVSLAQSFAQISDRPVRIDWYLPHQNGGWWYPRQRRRWIDKAHREIGLAPIEIQLTSILGHQFSSNDPRPAMSGRPDAKEFEVWFRIGISGPDAELPSWADPILLAL
jgi:hypothetical protein